MRFTILEEIKSTLPKSLFYDHYSQIKSNQIKCWFLMREENRSTRGRTSHGRVENQQTQSTLSTYHTECGNRTRATLVEGKCPHHNANPATRDNMILIILTHDPNNFPHVICIGNHTTSSSVWKYIALVGFLKSIKICNFSFLKKEREKSYDYFLLSRYITKLQSKFRIGNGVCSRHQNKRFGWFLPNPV